MFIYNYMFIFTYIYIYSISHGYNFISKSLCFSVGNMSYNRCHLFYLFTKNRESNGIRWVQAKGSSLEIMTIHDDFYCWVRGRIGVDRYEISSDKRKSIYSQYPQLSHLVAWHLQPWKTSMRTKRSGPQLRHSSLQKKGESYAYQN